MTLDTASLPLIPLAIGIVCLFVAVLNRPGRRRLPPGPKGLPILGNILDAPKEHEWRTFQEWGRTYDSDVVHFQILGAHYVVLNSAKATTELFERRSNLHSDKPQAAMINLTGWDRNLGLMKYGDFWRAHRKIFHQHFRSNAVFGYHQRSEKAVRQLLRLLYAEPECFIKHIRFMTAYNIIGIMYGVDITSEGDPTLAIVEEALDILQKVGNPGVYLVDSFPLLRFIPSWFPGAKFKRDAEAWKPIVDRMYIQPYNDVKIAYERGVPRPCVVTEMLAELYKDGANSQMLEQVIINTTGTGYAAASETASGQLTPAEMLTKLLLLDQLGVAELDRVIGTDRLPVMEDEKSLPYITALVRETLRWRPGLPLGVAHQSVADDEYEGYHIPAGTVLFGNARTILHDEERFPNPDTFNPSRFLDSDGHLLKHLVDAVSSAFGFGRRICPGRYFALDVVWLTVANVLSAFKIEKPFDEMGNVVEPSGEFTSGIVSCPVPFKAVFKPRSTVAFVQ
ncbi:uncharacterized protein PHACADRAFT_202500 [Phanerochaete carnosa HHB-10118-sp]|uniref:Cytochrome P450 n=1 Tax=Phanerochaete carnosa (strain HHB-10118-sp) TaxID=650164 RepID=K5WEV1_PHACS|nr:uncharacterized protein PHACADRAFT_202500 [Phanerochaete carnosa HHB-10118-sp]EKM48702.1 hypothetical protein PHACADRAFT_202500 [Phanerochaete carnosa HHB-10118-sp]